MDKAKTGQLIKNAREQKGYTQQELGDIGELPIRRFQDGRRVRVFPMLEYLKALLRHWI